jgi:uncharacterized protein GlcG (DUF336 family)
MSTEPTTVQHNVSAALARRMIDAGRSYAESEGKSFTIAIVDASGVLKSLERMDGAALVSIQVAQDKAYTAVGFGMPSGAWHDFIKDDPPLALGAADGIDRLVIFAGGFPIVVDGEVVGAVGVSGGHYAEDAAVAEAALAAVGG